MKINIELGKKIVRLLPDKIYLKLKYHYIFKQKLNLQNPQVFNEKIQWLKLYNRNPMYTMLVDKYSVKEYVAKKIGDEHVAKVLGVYDRFQDINFENLPSAFVVKCTHDSGGIVICKDKNKLDIECARKIIDERMKKDFYAYGREWPYKQVPRKVFVEEYLVDESGEELKDYKIFCFNGKAKFIQLDYDRYKDHHRNIYDCDWNLLPIEFSYKGDSKKIFSKPERLAEMLRYAEVLSAGIPFVRCDFYHLKEKVVFGEMTFFPESGFGHFTPNEYNRIFGELIEINI